MERSVNEMAQLGENVLLIDIRSKIAFQHGHIPNAICFPEPFEINGLSDYILNSSRNTVIVYCSVGVRSSIIVDKLRLKGINAYNLKGGYREWLITKANDLEHNECNQYSRQIILPEIGIEGQKKLKKAKVLVIGAGALGTAALAYLASAGVGHIGIVEGDVVERTNLHRQILYDINNLGKKKVYVAKERLMMMNEYISVIAYDTYATPDNINGLIKNYDFVIDATDRIETKFLINDACVIAHTPFCHGGILAFEGQVMTWMPGDYPCYRCIFEDVPDSYIPNCAEAGIIGAMAGMVGSIQALEAIKYITSTGELLVGKMFHFDGISMETRVIPFGKKNHSCKVCSNNAEILDVSKNPNKCQVNHCVLN